MSNPKKKPPPRPPPPKFNKVKSKSVHNISRHLDNLNLIDWSPPTTPHNEEKFSFGSSASSSFSSSTGSLSSNRRNIEYEQSVTTNKQTQRNLWNISSNSQQRSDGKQDSSPTMIQPSIIRPHSAKKPNKANITNVNKSAEFKSLPMPSFPPPSPPREVGDVITPYGIALFEFPATQPGDLGLEVDDVVILMRRVNDEWLYGQVGLNEGIFPQNFIQTIVPLQEDRS